MSPDRIKELIDLNKRCKEYHNGLSKKMKSFEDDINRISYLIENVQILEKKMREWRISTLIESNRLDDLRKNINE